MIREVIKNRIAAVPEVAAVCEGRVFWLRSESGLDTPCIIFRIIGGDPLFDDDSCGQTGPEMAVVEWYAVSEDPEQSVALQEAVKDAVRGPWAVDRITVHNSRYAGYLEDDYLKDGDKSTYLCGCRLEVTYA